MSLCILYLYLSIKSLLVKEIFQQEWNSSAISKSYYINHASYSDFCVQVEDKTQKDDFFLELNFSTNFYNLISSDLEIRRLFATKFMWPWISIYIVQLYVIHFILEMIVLELIKNVFCFDKPWYLLYGFITIFLLSILSFKFQRHIIIL